MLKHLQISNFTIIDRIDIDLEPGMTALTGETGAGKSILLDALAMVLGDRGDSGSIRVSVEKIDELMNTVGELVITQAMLSQLGAAFEGATAEKFSGDQPSN